MKFAQFDDRDVSRQFAPDCSLRIIQVYQLPADAWLLRFDVKFDKEQYVEAIEAHDPTPPPPGIPFRDHVDLVSPPLKAVENCLNLKVSRENLIEMLRGLLADLESVGDNR